MSRTSLDALRVSPEDWRVYDLAALEAHTSDRCTRLELLALWEKCVPALEHPTTAFAIRHLGIAHDQESSVCSPFVLGHVRMSTPPLICSDSEARFDAHDDKAYTRQQTLQRYASEYPVEEIEKYWNDLPPWWRPPEFGCISWSHFALTRNLLLHGIVRTGRVLDAVLATDRVHYAPQPELAYYEAPQELGENATLSSPRIHCCCFEAIERACFPGARVLDIGCGTGYVTAFLARMVGPSGHVIGLDVVEEYVERSERNMRRDDPELWAQGNVELRLGDGWWGSEDDGPFDCIHMACSAPRIPEPLLAQLKDGGRLILPVGPATPEWQNLTVITKGAGAGVGDGWSVEVIRPVRYVTMVHPPLMLRKGADPSPRTVWADSRLQDSVAEPKNIAAIAPAAPPSGSLVSTGPDTLAGALAAAMKREVLETGPRCNESFQSFEWEIID